MSDPTPTPALTYPSCKAWLDEIEVYSSQRERLLEAISSGDRKQVLGFVETAWRLGAAGSSDQAAEIERCHQRLEITHMWHSVEGDTDAEPVRVEIPYAGRLKALDGIYCRDATINILEDHVAELQAEITQMHSLNERCQNEREREAAKLNAEIGRLNGVLQAITMMTATGDGLSPDETIEIHLMADQRAALNKEGE